MPRAYGDYESLLADPEIDVVYNPLPNHLHVPWTEKAARAGKHVLCEKPIALDAAEAASLIPVRDETGLQIQEAYVVIHHPQWRRVRELVRDGRIGRLRAIQGWFSYWLDDAENIRNKREMGGGGLLDIGVYPLVTARFVFEAEPVRVFAAVERHPEWDVDVLTSAVLQFPTGTLSFTCGTTLAGYQHMAVHGTEGADRAARPLRPGADPRGPDQDSRAGRDLGAVRGGGRAAGEGEAVRAAGRGVLRGRAGRGAAGLPAGGVGQDDAGARRAGALRRRAAGGRRSAPECPVLPAARPAITGGTRPGQGRRHDDGTIRGAHALRHGARGPRRSGLSAQARSRPSLDVGKLRWIRYGGTEALRGLAFVVRGSGWETYAPEITNLEIEEGAGGFRVGYDARIASPDGVLAYRADIVADDERSLVFTVEFEPETEFRTSRTGFVALHPVEGVAGEACSISHSDGTVEETAFPGLIMPLQPFFDISAMRHQVSPGVWLTCRFEGADPWETEDQRNWTDASYKTYYRPLALPYPYPLGGG